MPLEWSIWLMLSAMTSGTLTGMHHAATSDSEALAVNFGKSRHRFDSLFASAVWILKKGELYKSQVSS